MNTHFATSQLSSMRPLSSQGMKTSDCYSQLRDFFNQNQDFLAANGMPNASAFLAEPVKNERTGLIDWYVEGSTAPVSLTSLPQAEQNAVRTKLAAYSAALNALLSSEAAQNSPQAADLLHSAMQHPSSADIYALNGEPVLVNWGFTPASLERLPENILAFAFGNPAAAAPASQTADTLSNPYSQNGVPVTDPNAPVIVKHKHGFLPWVPPILLTLTLSGLAMSYLGYLPSPLPAGLFCKDIPVGDEQQKADQLNAEAQALYGKLGQQYALCVPPKGRRAGSQPAAVPAAPSGSGQPETTDTAPAAPAGEAAPYTGSAPAAGLTPDAQAENTPQGSYPQGENAPVVVVPNSRDGSGSTVVVPDSGTDPTVVVPGARDGSDPAVVVPDSRDGYDPAVVVPNGPVVDAAPYTRDGVVVPGDKDKVVPGVVVPGDKDKVVPGAVVPYDKDKVVPGAVVPYDKDKAVPGVAVPDAKDKAVPYAKDKTVPGAVVPNSKDNPVVVAPNYVERLTPVIVAPDGKTPASGGKNRPLTKEEMPYFGESIFPGNPAKGAALQIPERAQKKQDVSFMEGCWVSDTGMVRTRDNSRVVVEFCFNKKGQGQRIIHEVGDKGLQCKGKANVSFSGNALSIKGDRAACPNGRKYEQDSVLCTGLDRSTKCTGKESDNIIWNARFRKK